ncbi:MAG: hypothetical protein ABSB28_05945 [Candidatus Bathyarchaeia archaeon]
MQTSKEIEEQIENYKLKFLDVRDERVEWEIKFPMFVETFNRFIREKGTIPSQEDFVERYFEDNAAELSSVLSSQSLKTGLEARLRRTYPSFVRDVHLNALLKEKGLEASYSQDTDIAGGVDHTLQYRGTTFYVHGYVGTSRGRFGRRIKSRRHKFHGIHIDIVLDLGGRSTKKVGDFYLYSEKDVEDLVGEMEKRLKK